MIKLNIPILTEVILPKASMLEVTLAFLRLTRTDSRMEFIREKNGKSMWCYDDPHHRHGSIREFEFQEATEKELLYYTTYTLLKDEKLQRN